MDLENILTNPEEYIVKEFRSKKRAKDFDEIIEKYGLDEEKVEEDLREMMRILKKKNITFTYPLELIVIPAYKFTKKPLIRWEELQEKLPNDREVIHYRYICGKLGYLINTLFLLRNFVVIDLDFNSIEDKEKYKKNVFKMFDVETKRGFHKYFYFDQYVAVGFKYKGIKKLNFWTTIHIPEINAKIDVRSSPRLLVIYPEQSHYIIFEDNILKAKKYRCISHECRCMIFSSDIYLLKSSVDSIKDFIISLIKMFNENLAKSIENNLELKPLEIDEYRQVLSHVQESSNVKDDYNSVIPITGNLTYNEFKNILQMIHNRLPPCIKVAFLENVKTGYCYAFARLSCTIIPFFVHVDDNELEKIAEDFHKRYESFRSPKKYYWNYFMFSIKPDGNLEGYPTRFGISDDVYLQIHQYVNCNNCEYNDQCIYFRRNFLGKENGLKPRNILFNLIKKIFQV
ncbi:MAG: hypothetical protein DRN12_05755 [Thermoplasmata archaeon]|nr:MAG: hypothetical protein DRN12_05755 [Thermoplasmata archaeon]